MQKTTIFRGSVVIGTLSYVGYWFLPYTYGYLSTDTGSLLSYAGYGAIYQGNETFDYLVFALGIACSIGLFLYRKLARNIYLIFVVAGIATIPMYGVWVETAGGAMLWSIANVMDGVALTMAYYSPVKDEFY